MPKPMQEGTMVRRTMEARWEGALGGRGKVPAALRCGGLEICTRCSVRHVCRCTSPSISARCVECCMLVYVCLLCVRVAGSHRVLRTQHLVLTSRSVLYGWDSSPLPHTSCSPHSAGRNNNISACRRPALLFLVLIMSTYLWGRFVRRPMTAGRASGEHEHGRYCVQCSVHMCMYGLCLYPYM